MLLYVSSHLGWRKSLFFWCSDRTQIGTLGDGLAPWIWAFYLFGLSTCWKLTQSTCIVNMPLLYWSLLLGEVTFCPRKKSYCLAFRFALLLPYSWFIYSMIIVKSHWTRKCSFLKGSRNSDEPCWPSLGSWYCREFLMLIMFQDVVPRVIPILEDWHMRSGFWTQDFAVRMLPYHPVSTQW